MATDLSICNAALTKLGQEPITALNDNNKRAKLLDANYERIKRKLLRQHTWNFAKKRVELTAELTTPVFGFSHEFLLPSDWIRLLEIENTGYEHLEENGKILYNGGEKLKLVYIYDAPESQFDSLFEDLFAVTLADELCFALVQSDAVKARLGVEMERLLGDARTTNAQSRGMPQEASSDELLWARR